MSSVASINLFPVKSSYSDFKFFRENRDVNGRNVERLAEEIEETYLLDLYPIVTDQEKVIEDGQHRFTVAREMLLPFYFIQSARVTVGEIAQANSNTRPYSVDDARQVYANLGLKAYQYINRFITENGIDVKTSRMPKQTSSVIKWLDPDCSRASFMNGDFVVRRPEYAQAVYNYIRDYANIAPFVARSKYVEVIANLAGNPLYDHGRMISKLNRVPTRLKRVPSVSEAIDVLNEIYNYGATEEKRVRLKMLTRSEQIDRFDKGTTPIDDGGVKVSRGVIFRSVQIASTSDYGMFSFHSCGRPVQEFHFARLKSAMKKHNLLDCYPIICDNNFTILDGQVRFLAAKDLGLPIYYIQTSSATLPMIVRASASSKSWAMRDYLHHYCSLGLGDYLELHDFCKEYPFLNLQVSIKFLGGPVLRSEIELHRFKSGQFLIGNMQLARIVANALRRLDDKKLINRRTFQFVLYGACREAKVTGFDPDFFVKQANLYPELMADFADKDSCKECIEKTYNHCNRSRKFLFRSASRELAMVTK